MYSREKLEEERGARAGEREIDSDMGMEIGKGLGTERVDFKS